MLHYFYLPSLFLNNPQSCLINSDSIRHYQPLFHKSILYFSCSNIYTFDYIYLTILGFLRLLNKEQQIIFGKENILRNHSNMPRTFKSEMVSDNRLPFSLSLFLYIYIYIYIYMYIFTVTLRNLHATILSVENYYVLHIASVYLYPQVSGMQCAGVML